MKEVWKDVFEFDGEYQASNTGKIKSLKWGKERILKTNYDTRGYPQIQLYKNGKWKNFKVHKLVALLFLPNPDNKPQVNHKFGDKTQNIVDLDNLYGDTTTLEWATNSENMEHAYKTGLHKRSRGKNNPHVKAILQYDKQGNLIKIWDCMKDIERELHIQSSNICKCCKQKLPTAGGYIWRYKDAS